MVDIVNEDGEVISPETVEYSYTREGRKEIGKEYPNPIPMELPLGQQPHEPIWEMISRMVLTETMKQRAAETGEELDTPEEADDFDVGDDFDPASPYEHDFEPTDPWPASRAVVELTQRINEERNKGRIATLQGELEALRTGKPWPPVPETPASPTPPAQPASAEPDEGGSA